MFLESVAKSYSTAEVDVKENKVPLVEVIRARLAIAIPFTFELESITRIISK